jgi:hypothetical protein
MSNSSTQTSIQNSKKVAEGNMNKTRNNKEIINRITQEIVR